MKSSMLLRKYETSPLMRGYARQRSATSKPSAFSDSRSGLPISNAKLPWMRPEEIELFERRISRGPREADGNRQLVLRGRRTEENPTDPDDVRKIPDGRSSSGLNVAWFDPAAELERHVGPRQFLVEEPGDPLFFDRRRQRFFANCRERPIQKAAADRSSQSPCRSMTQPTG